MLPPAWTARFVTFTGETVGPAPDSFETTPAETSFRVFEPSVVLVIGVSMVIGPALVAPILRNCPFSLVTSVSLINSESLAVFAAALLASEPSRIGRPAEVEATSIAPVPALTAEPV